MTGAVAGQELEIESALLEQPAVIEQPRSLEPVDAPRRGQNAKGGPVPVRAVPRPSPPELLQTPGALLTRSHLRRLGLERRAIDAVFRALPVVALPGYSRPLIRAEEYLQLVEQHTYRDDRVRPCHA